VGEQIEFVLPLTLLSYKTGFPAEVRRQRNVHVFLYRILIGLLEEIQAQPSPQGALAGIFIDAFGKGSKIGGAPKYDGAYDGETPVDLHSLLCLCFLDGFQATDASNKEGPSPYGPALPTVAREMAKDLLRYVLAYRDRMPVLALTRGLMALINFHLFIYTAKLIYATNELVRQGSLPTAMRSEASASEPEIFVDFTRERASDSDQLARACVERDVEEFRTFYDSALWLRTVDRFIDLLPQLKVRLVGLSTPDYLYGLTKLRDDPGVAARAQAELESIRFETLEACETEAEKTEARALFDDEQRYAGGSSLEFAVRILSLAQQKKGMENYVRWFWSSGGLRKDFGLLAGSLTGRRNWRYAMSDDLLAALVQLALVGDPRGQLSNIGVTRRLPLIEFLAFLEQRFGVLVDRPPAFLEDARFRSAARENLEALKHRLRQMGFFEALSDDFTAQYLGTPLRTGSAG
jgi:hypothetical protein